MKDMQSTLRHNVDPFQQTQLDDIYQHPRPYKYFSFDQEVVSVFPDMIGRSVPGYWLSNQGIGIFTKRYAQPQTNIYDLGCSLGASTYSILQQEASNDAQLVAIDASPQMIAHFQRCVAQQFPHNKIDIHCADICETPLNNASVVILHYTLQFVSPEKRNALLQKIYDALVPRGILLLSEKIRFDETEMETDIRMWHHDFKAAEGYSALEIEQKARDIKHSMQTDTLNQLTERLETVGFSKPTIWMRCFGFVSFVVQK